jgi:ATP-dependent exoDNAse (exonuclease V) beta subunit
LLTSVYLSGGDSVFATTEAADLQLILTACLNPTNDRSLRAALACPLFNLNANALDQLSLCCGKNTVATTQVDAVNILCSQCITDDSPL